MAAGPFTRLAPDVQVCKLGKRFRGISHVREAAFSVRPRLFRGPLDMLFGARPERASGIASACQFLGCRPAERAIIHPCMASSHDLFAELLQARTGGERSAPGFHTAILIAVRFSGRKFVLTAAPVSQSQSPVRLVRSQPGGDTCLNLSACRGRRMEESLAEDPRAEIPEESIAGSKEKPSATESSTCRHWPESDRIFFRDFVAPEFNETE